jgi:hypothetical protein
MSTLAGKTAATTLVAFQFEAAVDLGMLLGKYEQRRAKRAAQMLGTQVLARDTCPRNCVVGALEAFVKLLKLTEIQSSPLP